jgi:large subunit ribosomal protein L6
MSRIGRSPIEIPKGVSISVEGACVKIQGPKGMIQRSFGGNLEFKIENSHMVVAPKGSSAFDLSMWGTARSIIQTCVIGVTKGFVKELEMSPYRGSLRVGESYCDILGNKIKSKSGYIYLDLGKSHSTWIEIPDHISVESVEHISRDKRTSIRLSAIDKEKLGFFTSSLIKQRPLNPYKGHGIRHKDQKVVLKEIKKQK